MIRRTLQAEIERLATGFPVITLTGPRQSGKTTLARMIFPNKAYVSLESPAELSWPTRTPSASSAASPTAPSWTRFSARPSSSPTCRPQSTPTPPRGVSFSPARRTSRCSIR